MQHSTRNYRTINGTDTWKNPYLAQRVEKQRKRISKDDLQQTKGKENDVRNAGVKEGQDVTQLIQQFREGIRGISTSVQQFEKTIDSLTQLYQTIERLGGFHQFAQWINPTERSGTNPLQYDFQHMLKHIESLIGLLEKVDMKQVQQFLNSPFIRNILMPNANKE